MRPYAICGTDAPLFGFYGHDGMMQSENIPEPQLVDVVVGQRAVFSTTLLQMVWAAVQSGARVRCIPDSDEIEVWRAGVIECHLIPQHADTYHLFSHLLGGYRVMDFKPHRRGSN